MPPSCPSCPKCLTFLLARVLPLFSLQGKFIDKKKSQTFNVVRRSQRDPLIADESSSPLVLVPVDGPRVCVL